MTWYGKPGTTDSEDMGKINLEAAGTKNYCFTDGSSSEIISPDIVKIILERIQVVCATSTMVGSSLLQKCTFHTAIIDEAGQITETSAIIPLIKASNYILVGDHMQLPPISSEESRKSQEIDEAVLEKIGLSKKDSLSTSIFERLSRKLIGTDAFITLKYQYRMNDIICKFSSDQFYDGVIKAGEINKRSVGDQTLADFFKAYNIQNINFDNRRSSAYFFHPDLPFIFINTESIQLYDSTVSSKAKGSPADASSQTESIFNIGEAKVVVSILKFFLHKICEVSRPTEEILEIVSKIGVISGFRAQNQTIRELLTEELMNPNSDVLKRLSNPREIADNIIIDTVDRFQGQEREIIIFSCVDSNPDSILSNNNREVRRMNVSITRAKKKLIFIGNGKTLAKINPEDEEETKNAKKMFQNLMDFAEKNEGLIRFT